MAAGSFALPSWSRDELEVLSELQEGHSFIDETFAPNRFVRPESAKQLFAIFVGDNQPPMDFFFYLQSFTKQINPRHTIPGAGIARHRPNLCAVLPPALLQLTPAAPRGDLLSSLGAASRHLVPTGVGRPTGVLLACGQSLATVRAAVSPLR